MTSQEKEEARRRVANACNDCAVFSLMFLIMTALGLIAWLVDHLAGWHSMRLVLKVVMIGYPGFLLICFSAGYLVKKRELEALNQGYQTKVRDLP